MYTSEICSAFQKHEKQVFRDNLSTVGKDLGGYLVKPHALLQLMGAEAGHLYQAKGCTRLPPRSLSIITVY